jgi:hypothetical protein
MEIIDAQVHDPRPVRPLDPRYGEDVDLLLGCELAREAMDSVGVDIALSRIGCHGSRPRISYMTAHRRLLTRAHRAGVIKTPRRTSLQPGRSTGTLSWVVKQTCVSGTKHTT